jgi:hypothetical protein
MAFIRLLLVVIFPAFLFFEIHAGAYELPPASAATSDFARQLVALRESAARDPALQAQVAVILGEAQRVLALPIIQRASSLAQIRQGGAQRFGAIDGRTPALEKANPLIGETFGLAMVDVSDAQTIQRELPLLAAAWWLTGDPAYPKRIADQLAETATWAPLQRPGWTLLSPSNKLPEGGDGVWLATGSGLVAICQVLEILPAGTLPDATVQAARVQLAREIKLIHSDWDAKRGWFVREHVPGTNQWIVPASGMMVAAATLGREEAGENYDFAFNLLQQSLGELGSEGAVSEGFTYGSHWIAPFLYLAAGATAAIGDDRIASDPFFKNFPVWVCENFQPGQSVVDDFDNFGGARNLYHGEAEDISCLVALSRNPMLAWVLRRQIKMVFPNLYGLLSLSIPDSALQVPPLWGSWKLSRCVMWRSSWDDDASGVWVRGGHPLDDHDHWDRGHVNFIAHGHPLLIEAGTPGYGEPLKKAHYDSVWGHNVLEVGSDLYPKKTDAPITVNRLDATGGDVVVDAGQGYPQVSRWTRQVSWDAGQVEVSDTVELKEPEAVLFRWHLGSEQPLAIVPKDAENATASLPPGRIVFPGWIGKLADGDLFVPPKEDVVETPSATISVVSDQPVTLTQEKDYDHIMKFRVQKHLHTTLVVSSQGKISKITLKTVIAAP